VDAHVLRSAAAEQPGSAAKHPSSAVASPASAVPTSPSSASPAGLQVCVNLSSYPLQHLPGIGHTSPCPAACQHHMVLRPRQPKTTLSTATATTFVASFSRVVSPPSHEPLVFNDANRYEVWHSAMREEIQALCGNKTWTLVSFHPSMNVVRSRWVYSERLVSLSKKVLITLKPLVLSTKRRPSD